ncbi:unnamed protein product [Boreogadus saida]
MSQEDVKSTHSGSSDQQADDADLDPPPGGQGFGQDSVVLEHIATLSLDTFEPGDFKGRFTKVQSKSRKRCNIIREQLVLLWTAWSSQHNP